MQKPPPPPSSHHHHHQRQQQQQQQWLSRLALVKTEVEILREINSKEPVIEFEMSKIDR